MYRIEKINTKHYIAFLSKSSSDYCASLVASDSLFNNAHKGVFSVYNVKHKAIDFSLAVFEMNTDTVSEDEFTKCIGKFMKYKPCNMLDVMNDLAED